MKLSDWPRREWRHPTRPIRVYLGRSKVDAKSLLGIGGFPAAKIMHVLQPPLATFPLSHSALLFAAPKLAQGQTIRNVLDNLVLEPTLGIARGPFHPRIIHLGKSLLGHMLQAVPFGIIERDQ